MPNKDGTGPDGKGPKTGRRGLGRYNDSQDQRFKHNQGKGRNQSKNRSQGRTRK